MRRVWLAFASAALAVTGCAAPYDDDGEVTLAGGTAAPPPAADATPVVVDTDLGGDDLAALALLLRHPDVQVVAITVAGSGLVGCHPGADIVSDLLTVLEEPAVPIACTAASPRGRSFPEEWREVALTGTGIPRPASTLLTAQAPASALVARMAEQRDGLVLVALGPLTMAAELARRSPASYGRLAGVHVMGGSVSGELEDGVAEWNAAADPPAFASVLAGGAPVTVVPADAVPTGTPEALASAPVVSRVAATIDYAAWWDLAAAAALVTDVPSLDSGTWSVDDTGRLTRTGDGSVDVVRSLDAAVLEEAYGVAFG